MPVFQVYLNGKRVSTAGVGDLGVLGAHVSWMRRQDGPASTKKPASVAEELALHVGGLNTAIGEHILWLDRKLKVGDEVSIRVVQDAPVDRPRQRKRRDSAGELRSQKRYVKAMAKQFGWKIQT